VRLHLKRPAGRFAPPSQHVESVHFRHQVEEDQVRPAVAHNRHRLEALGTESRGLRSGAGIVFRATLGLRVEEFAGNTQRRGRDLFCLQSDDKWMCLHASDGIRKQRPAGWSDRERLPERCCHHRLTWGRWHTFVHFTILFVCRG
jgi:hypothetical protein